jgi:hypothetical protein
MNPSEKFSWNKNGSAVLDRNKIYTIGKDKILTTIVKFSREEWNNIDHPWYDSNIELLEEVLNKRTNSSGLVVDKIKRIKNFKDEVVFKVWYN